MVLRVVLAGGGTAGHVNPLLATADILEGRGQELACSAGLDHVAAHYAALGVDGDGLIDTSVSLDD